MTAFSNTELAINATRLGAFDFLPKPVSLRQLREVIGQALELRAMNRLAAELEDELIDVGHSDSMVGNSPAMQHVYKQIGRVARQQVNVLIRGESGTGKELCARSLHFYGLGPDRPFVAVNAAAIPDTLLESELFGHEKGAFTGAAQRRVGKFEQARGGTLFLDEIGDMPLALQAKLLRSLQEKQFQRVGGSQLIESDVRIVAATNQNLGHLIASEQFRSDLFYRLNGFTIEIPPLRSRIEDLPSLVKYFINKLNRETGRMVRGLAPGVMQMLSSHGWPGNVRELQNAVHHAFVNTTGDMLTTDAFPVSCWTDPGVREEVCDLNTMIEQQLRSGSHEISRMIHDQVDLQLLSKVLEHCRGNRKAASELLGISRTTLLSKLRTLGLDEL